MWCRDRLLVLRVAGNPRNQVSCHCTTITTVCDACPSFTLLCWSSCLIPWFECVSIFRRSILELQPGGLWLRLCFSLCLCEEISFFPHLYFAGFRDRFGVDSMREIFFAIKRVLRIDWIGRSIDWLIVRLVAWFIRRLQIIFPSTTILLLSI